MKKRTAPHLVSCQLPVASVAFFCFALSLSLAPSKVSRVAFASASCVKAAKSPVLSFPAPAGYVNLRPQHGRQSESLWTEKATGANFASSTRLNGTGCIYVKTVYWDWVLRQKTVVLFYFYLFIKKIGRKTKKCSWPCKKMAFNRRIAGAKAPFFYTAGGCDTAKRDINPSHRMLGIPMALQ